MWLKQSTAVTLKIGPFLDDTDGKTPETALTISQGDVLLSKNGGAFAQKNDSTACSGDTKGYYGCPLNTTDTNTLGILQFIVVESGALPVFREYMVVPANTYDSLVSGSDKVDVNAVEISGDTTAADNLEKACDGTTYNIGGGAVVAASVTGAVGSVTGAVGSVTGNVGGNVAGSVASVTGAVGSVTGAVGSVTGNVGGNVAGSVASVAGAVGSVTAGVTVTTNNDKTGYALTATTGLGNQTANITGNLSGSVGSVTGAVGSVTGNVGGSVASVTGAVGSVTGAVGSVTGNVGGNVTGSIGSLATQAKADVNAEVDSALGDYDAPTKAEADTRFSALDSAIAALNNISVADIMGDTIESSITLEQGLRIFLAALAGKSTGGGTSTLTFRDVADAKARITATVDANGNRTAVTRDGT